MQRFFFAPPVKTASRRVLEKCDRRVRVCDFSTEFRNRVFVLPRPVERRRLKKSKGGGNEADVDRAPISRAL